MFCPKCSAYLMEKELIKTGVKYAPGNIPIEYDACCPKCSAEMGHVSWGQLTPNPALEQKSGTEPRKSQQNTGEDTETKHCPHCGKPLPKDF